MPNSDKPPDGWNEYKRLVLAELERLNQAVEKLREQFISAEIKVTKDLSELQTSITEALDKVIEKGDKDISKEVTALENNLRDFKRRFHKDSKDSNTWGFWAAIIGMITSLAVAVISLVITLSK